MRYRGELVALNKNMLYTQLPDREISMMIYDRADLRRELKSYYNSCPYNH